MTDPIRPTRPLRAALGATLAALLLAAPASAATFYSPAVNAQPGGAANVCVWMAGGNNDVAGVQMDITWDPQCMLPASGGTRPKCRSNPDTGKTVQSALRGGSTLRAIMISFADVEPIPDGELFCCEFRIVDKPTSAACGLSFSNVIASTPRGQRTDARIDSNRSGGVRIGGVGVSGGAPAAVAPAAPAPAAPAGDYADAGSSDTGAAAGDGGAEAGSGSDSGAPRQQVPAAPGGGEGSARAAAEPGAGMPAGAPGSSAPGAGAAGAGATGAGTTGTGSAGDAAAADYAAGENEPGGFVREAAPEAAAQPAADTDVAADADETETPAPATTPAATTPTPAATSKAAAAPTATPPAATPTPAQPTATPTVSSGFLGGCQLIVD